MIIVKSVKGFEDFFFACWGPGRRRGCLFLAFLFLTYEAVSLYERSASAAGDMESTD